MVASLVAIGSGRLGALPIGHPDEAVRSAAVAACALARKRTGPWLQQLWNRNAPPEVRASLLVLFDRFGLEAPGAAAWLGSADLAVRRAAARALRQASPATLGAAGDELLDDPDDAVREAALVAGLGWRSSRAWAACEAWALDPQTARPLPMLLYAVLGGSAHHDRLAKQLAHPTHVRAALFALGYSGDVGVLPALSELLVPSESPLAKVAAQAIATITGIDLARFARPADAADTEMPPPLDDDPLDADLVGAPEDALPCPDPDGIRAVLDARFRTAPRTQPLLAGRPRSLDVELDFLRRAPMRRRHAVALALQITRGLRFDTRAWPRNQLQQLAEVRSQAPREVPRA
jgi:uncharacterized protein (TIGR02270 family)